MNPQDFHEPDDEVGRLLRRDLSRRLDPQLGRAAIAFEAHHARRTRHARLVWMCTGLGTVAAAAALAIALLPRDGVIAPGRGPNHTEIATTAPTSAPAADGRLQEVVWTRNLDQGVVFLDDETPARKVLRQKVREYRWTDASGNRHVETAAPENEVMLIGLDTY